MAAFKQTEMKAYIRVDEFVKFLHSKFFYSLCLEW